MMTNPHARIGIPPARTPAIQLVCFDLGRVLIEICDGWEDACREAGVTFPVCLGEMDRRQRMVDLALEHETGRIDAGTFDREMARLLGMSPEQVAAVSCAWLKSPCPNIEWLIDAVRQSGVATACLSNTNDRHWRMMSGQVDSPARLPVDRLDHHFVSYVIGAMKPDPAIYAHVEEATGVAPHQIAFFDDLPDNVDAARRRGWYARRITPEMDSVSQMHEALVEWGVLR